MEALSAARGFVIVIDDDQSFLESIVLLLTVEGYRVKGFSSANAFLADASNTPASCVITDIRMPEIDGLTLIARLRQTALAGTPIIVISGHADVQIAVTAMQIGACTVLEKPFAPSLLIAAVETAIRNSQISGLKTEAVASVFTRYKTLSPREREVMMLLVRGSSSKVVAIQLGLSPRTVETFRANILRKMKSSNMVALATEITPIISNLDSEY